MLDGVQHQSIAGVGMRLLRLVLLTILVIGSAVRASSAQILGVTWTGDVVLVDPATAEGGVVGTVGWDEVNAMSKDVNGRLVACSNSPTPTFLELDPVTYQGTLVDSALLHDVRSIAFSSTDPMILYATDIPSGVGRWLFRFDLNYANGDPQYRNLIDRIEWAGTYIPVPGIQAMTMAPDGTLYAWSTGAGLVTVDPTTARAVNVSGVSDGSSAIQSIFFDDAGVLYGIYDELYTIDTTTGARTLVGAGGWSNVRAASIAPGQCDVSTYCIASPNSAGPGALIGWSGSSSVAANDLVLEIQGSPPGRFGSFFYGPNQTQVPFGDGYRCAGGGVHRLGVTQSDAAGDASHALDITAPPVPAAQIEAGSWWNFQYWYRDPSGPGGSGFNLSNGLSVRFCP